MNVLRKLVSFSAASLIALQLAATPALSQSNFQALESKTYLINGLASAIPFIGYGMANLKKKIAGARLFSYVSPIEGSAVIQPSILREIRKLHRRNPNIQINLIGISYGATLVTTISSILAKENIPVNYLGVVDGRPLAKIHSNVRYVDNFTCTFIDCIGVRLKMARGNQQSEVAAFKFRSTHINLGNNNDMHNRVIQQISTYRPLGQSGEQQQFTNSIDNRPVASIPRGQ